MSMDRMKALENVLGDLLDSVVVPERDCACPPDSPCESCVEDQFIRDALARGNKLLRKSDIGIPISAQGTAEARDSVAEVPAIQMKPLDWQTDEHGDLRAQSIRGGEGVDAVRAPDGRIIHYWAWGDEENEYQTAEMATAAVEAQIKAEIEAAINVLARPQPAPKVSLRITGPNSDGEYWLHLKNGDGPEAAGINLGGDHLMIASALLKAAAEGKA